MLEISIKVVQNCEMIIVIAKIEVIHHQGI